MSAFQFAAQGAISIAVNVSDDTPTPIVDAAERAVIVPWFCVAEIGGGTQSLTVDLFDGTEAYYLADDAGAVWLARAATAKAACFFSHGLVVPRGWMLRVTSSAATGLFHVHGIAQRQG